jgi:Tol biopolymer transport system component
MLTNRYQGLSSAQVIKIICILFLFFTVYPSLFIEFLWAQPPQILSIQPAIGSRGVKTDSLIRITFTKEMEKRSVEENFLIEPHVKGTFSWQKKTLIFRPDQDLIPFRTYTISLGNMVKDVQGGPLALSYFTTIEQILYIDRGDIWMANADGSGRKNLTNKIGNYCKPLWLEENKEIIFELDSDLWKMDRAGANKKPLTAGKAVVSHEFLPSPDGKKVAILSKNGEIRVVTTEEGKETKIFVPEDPETNNLGLGCPFAWSPDSKYLLHNRLSKGKILDVWMVDILTKEEKPLTKNRWENNDWGFRFSPDGSRIAYVIEGTLYTMNNDGSDKKKVSGDIELNEGRFSFSPDGKRLIFLANYNIWVVNTDASQLRQITEGTNSNYIDWLPDGKKIILISSDEETNTNNIWIMELEGQKQISLTKGEVVSGSVEHSASGNYLSFYSIKDTNSYFRIMNVDGTGRQILSVGKEASPPPPNPHLWSH